MARLCEPRHFVFAMAVFLNDAEALAAVSMRLRSEVATERARCPYSIRSRNEGFQDGFVKVPRPSMVAVGMDSACAGD